MKNKIVYVAMVGDMLHSGHINIITEAKKLGQVIVGVLTDEAVASYKRVPLIAFHKRREVISNIAGIERVIAQGTLSYADNLKAIRPDYVVHGDDWQAGGPNSLARQEVVDVLKEWGGELVEVPYTQGISSTIFHRAMEEEGVFARYRQGRLRRLLDVKPCLRIIEAHSGLCALVAKTSQSNGRKYDALWQSSFTDAANRGKPDIEIVDLGARIAAVNDVFSATDFPMIFDGDTGVSDDRTFHMTAALDKAGVSAICLEDKIGPKRNSLYGVEIEQSQATTEEFCSRIAVSKSAMRGSSMMFIARIESLVLGKPMADAIVRAERYIAAGADAILVHSLAPTAAEVLEFCSELRRSFPSIPVFVVPTTYGGVGFDELCDGGVKGVIYANQLLRAAFRQMSATANLILQEQRAAGPGFDEKLASTRDLLSLIPERG